MRRLEPRDLRGPRPLGWMVVMLAAAAAGWVGCGKSQSTDPGAPVEVIHASLVPDASADPARSEAKAGARTDEKAPREAAQANAESAGGAMDADLMALATNDTPAGKAWRLARDKRAAEARQILDEEIAAGRRTTDVVGTQLAIELSERSDAELMQKARAFLQTSQGSFIAGTVRLLLSHHQLEAGSLAEAARSLVGDENWFVRSTGGLLQADQVAAAADKSGAAEDATLALSVLLDGYTRGPLDFERHFARLNRYHDALKLKLNKLLFDPAGTWHSREHKVRPNESLTRICKRYANLDAGALRLESGLLQLVNRMKSDRLLENQRLRIPVDPFRTVVEKRSFTLKVFLGDVLIRLYRVGLGEGGRTPATRFVVGEKIEKPTWWTPNGSIPYGHPDNVLGDYFVKFVHDRNQGFGIHGTTDTDSIGKERSQGCVRLLKNDLRDYFSLVPVGTPVDVRD
jgi:hypothetical protein